MIIFLTLSLNLNAKTINIHNNAKNIEVSKKISKMFLFAKKGNTQAQFDLAITYAMGIEVIKDEKKAFYWFHKSARGGNIEAKYYMGLSFLQGRGVRRDIHLARYWFKQASRAGHKKAIFYLGQVENSLHKNNRYITKSYLSKI